MTRKLLLGSGNAKKLQELERRLLGLQVQIVSLKDLDRPIPEPDEPHEVFVANAMQKALAYANGSGLLTLADDSGLEVDALDGRPGVHSAYFAGRPSNDERNNAKLLSELSGIRSAERTARYRCVLALAAPGRVLWVTEGTCEGAIGESPRGGGGFGYDPLFLVNGGRISFGELDPADKDRISHRGKALLRLRQELPRLLSDYPIP